MKTKEDDMTDEELRADIELKWAELAAKEPKPQLTQSSIVTYSLPVTNNTCTQAVQTDTDHMLQAYMNKLDISIQNNQGTLMTELFDCRPVIIGEHANHLDGTSDIAVDTNICNSGFSPW